MDIDDESLQSWPLTSEVRSLIVHFDTDTNHESAKCGMKHDLGNLKCI
jgi:hypothetical protein